MLGSQSNYSSNQRVSVEVPPAEFPITLAELKEHLRITDTDEDTYLSSLIEAATATVEQFLGRKLITQQLKVTMDCQCDNPWWSGTVVAPESALTGVPREYELPWLPVQMVDEVATYTEADNRLVFAATNYRVSSADPDLWARVVLREGAIWPTDLRNVDSIETLYTVGYGTASEVPPSIKQGVLIVAAYMYENRGDCGGGDAGQCACDTGISGILRQYRVMKI